MVMPPRPCCLANRPTTRRRLFSSRVATKSFKAPCCLAVGPSGWLRQREQGQLRTMACFPVPSMTCLRLEQWTKGQRCCTENRRSYSWAPPKRWAQLRRKEKLLRDLDEASLTVPEIAGSQLNYAGAAA